jgi:hypothetical protein
MRSVAIFAVAMAITSAFFAIIGWIVPFAGNAMMAYVQLDPDGPLWLRLLTPVLPALSFLVFALVVAARRRKAAKAGSDIAAP